MLNVFSRHRLHRLSAKIARRAGASPALRRTSRVLQAASSVETYPYTPQWLMACVVA